MTRGQHLAYALYNKVPNNHKYLFKECVDEDKDYGNERYCVEKD